MVRGYGKSRNSSAAVRRRAVVSIGAALALGVAAISAAPALAAPEWGIEMTHANAYGLQAGECPGGKEISVPGEPEKDCGVDPYTGSGTTLAQESGFNTYKIRVTNTAPPATGPTAGDSLSCEAGTWYESPSFTYAWLRDGTVIPGAESDEYTLAAADEGKAVQCQVTATNISGGAVAVTNAIAVSPSEATALPALEAGGKVSISGESGTLAVGSTLTCEHGPWSGSPSYSYRWLRNGVPIPGAEDDEYTLANADAGTPVQCQVIATNGGGSVAAENEYFTYVGANEPSPYPPYYTAGPGIPTPKSSQATSGPVTVADRLPEGLRLAGSPANPAVSGSGWGGSAGEGECTIVGGGDGFSCTDSNSLAPGESYPPIVLHVRVGRDAPSGSPPSGGVTNIATVAGGGAATSSSTSDPTVISPAVPFGIESFSTDVTEPLGNPFTQSAGHPVAATAKFVLNYAPDDGGELETAGGTTKAAETELPAGFVAAPESVARCTAAESQLSGGVSDGNTCPAASVVGFVAVELEGAISGGRPTPFATARFSTALVYSLEPPPGAAAAFAFTVEHAYFALTARPRSDGDYGITVGDNASGRAGDRGIVAVALTLCGYGVEGHGSEGSTPTTAACANPTPGARPFLTLPSRCTGPAPSTTLLASSYQKSEDYVSKTVYNGTSLVAGAPSSTESLMTGCNGLTFEPEVEFGPSAGAEGGTTRADEPTGAAFDLKVPQAKEAAGVNATPALEDATVTLPEGMTADPSAANGLQTCSNAQFGLGSTVEPAEPAECPLAAQVGTADVCTPLLANQTGSATSGEEVDRECEAGKAAPVLQGQVFIGQPECGVGGVCTNADAADGRLFRLFLQVRAPARGVIVKLAGEVSANPLTGRLQATFTEQPQLPFGELRLQLKGGPRAPLANPQTCGTATTTTELTPWSAPGLGGLSGSEAIAGTPDATPSASFSVDWDGAGGACPAALPFGPSFSAGSQTSAAGGSSPFAVEFGRQDREQDLSGIAVTTPPGLLGKVSAAQQCPETQANAGTCGSASQIGTATVAAGAGADPYYLTGNVYLTGPYRGAPFGLSVAVPAAAGPFTLAGNTGSGLEVVRAAIAVNPSTAALTITSDPLPQIVDGVPLRLRTVRVEVNAVGGVPFMLNPTSCARQTVGATITAAQGASSTVTSPYEVGGCSSLPFAPKLTASTQGRTSKAGGASLTVNVASTPGQANIAKVDLELPKALPSRLTTLQKACTEAQFAANPAGCPAASDIGTATAVTPILNAPLTGPAYIVSHGGAGFPDVELVLQGEGVEIVLDGKTDIKGGVTYSRFETVPDAPIGRFEAVLPEGPHSILATDIPASAHGSLCGRALTIPTIITGQNGKQLRQSTKVAVSGCKGAQPLTRAQQLSRALKQCKRHKRKQVRAGCEKQARKRYGHKPKTAKAKRSGTRPANDRGGKRS